MNTRSVSVLAVLLAFLVAGHAADPAAQGGLSQMANAQSPGAGSVGNDTDMQPSSTAGHVTVAIDSDRPSYYFGETAVLTGSVSEAVHLERPVFVPAEITITISGPDYYDVITEYPDYLLGFSTSIALQEVLGVNPGVYDVVVEYAGAVDTAQFSVGHRTVQAGQADEAALSVRTDSDSYMPGQTATILASTTKQVQFEGMKFSVTSPDGNTVVEGILFPSDDVNVRDTFEDVGDAQFVTDMFITTVSPVYGTYTISAQYSTQTAVHTFEVVPDTKEESVVTLATDKPAYEPGETVTIYGRSNQHFVPTLSLEVIQSANLALGHVGGTSLKILDQVRLEGDGSFDYEIPLSANFASFGEYRVTVSGEIGRFTTTFAVMEDSEEFVANNEPLSVHTDKDTYNIGEPMIISGTVKDPIHRSTFETPSVVLTIQRDDGSDPISIVGLPKSSKTRTGDTGIHVDLSFTAVPDPAGNFYIGMKVTRSSFEAGTYTINAAYGDLTSSTSVSVLDPLDVGSTTIVASIDKEVYGLGEVLTLTGMFGAQVTDSQGVVLTMYKPDGDTDKFGTTIDGGLFSWTWETPISAVITDTSNERSIHASNLGVYRLNIETGGNHADLFFKVSADPENDSFSTDPITLYTDKSIYYPGDRLGISGSVVIRQPTAVNALLPELVNIRVVPDKPPYTSIHEANVYPVQGGLYSSTFELLPTLFLDGMYKVRASYHDARAEAVFSVANDFVFGGEAPVELILDLDGDTYHPGQTVTLTGKPNKIVYVEKFDVSIIKQSEVQLDCGSFYCGKHIGPITSIRPDPSVGFTYTYDIPEGGSLGSYEITVDVGFDTKSVAFNVVEGTEGTAPATPSRIIDKVSRIAESRVSITPEPKTSEGYDLSPRVISGSLIAPERDQESYVNLQVISPGGACIIGQTEGCLVSGSTRTQGSVHSVVEFDGAEYKVRYSGPESKLERFSILPALDGGILPMESFDVSVIKGEQESRFYYKIVYIPL